MNISDALQIVLSLFTPETIIGVLVTLVGGFFVKKFPGIENRLIPVLTLIAAVVTQLINFFNGLPPVPPIPVPADSTLGMLAAPTYDQAGIFSGFPLKVIIAAILQWIAVDKIYETQKKAVVGMSEVLNNVSKERSQL